MSEEKLTGSITVNSACITAFSFQTNGYQGGDAGHGGYLQIAIEDLAGTMMNAVLDNEPMPQSAPGNQQNNHSLPRRLRDAKRRRRT